MTDKPTYLIQVPNAIMCRRCKDSFTQRWTGNRPCKCGAIRVMKSNVEALVIGFQRDWVELRASNPRQVQGYDPDSVMSGVIDSWGAEVERDHDMMTSGGFTDEQLVEAAASELLVIEDEEPEEISAPFQNVEPRP